MSTLAPTRQPPLDPDLPQHELQRLYHAGDLRAHCVLFERERALFITVARKAGALRQVVAEQALLDAESKLERPQAYERYDPARPYRGYAARTVWHCALSLVRKRANKTCSLDEALVGEPAALDGEHRLFPDEIALIQAALNILSPRQRLVASTYIDLGSAGGMKSVAESLDLPLPTCWSAWRSALTKMRNYLARQGMGRFHDS